MQAMLPCIACKRHVIEDGEEDQEDEEEDDYNGGGGRNARIAKAEVKSLSSQLKDVVLKVSTAYRQCRPCAGSKGNTFEQEFVTDASSSDQDHWIQKSGMIKKGNYPTSSAGSSISEGAASGKQDDLSSSKVSPSSQASSNSSSSSNGVGVKDSSSKPDPGRDHQHQQQHQQQHNKNINSPIQPAEDATQEWVAQVEPGVLITFIAMPNGENELKRIRFSRELFNKWQAEAWWAENCERVHELYNVPGNDHSFPNGRKDQADSQPSTTEVSRPKQIEELSEWVEEDEPGVYITVKLGPNGNRELKRVRFSREKFSERQAKLWWERNRFRIHDNYL